MKIYICSSKLFFDFIHLVIIQDLCHNWSILEPGLYALKFSDKDNTNYVTEKNRSEVKNGSILQLRHSPEKTSSDILHTLRSSSDNVQVKVKDLEKLSTLCADPTFAAEFILQQGLSTIISMIEDESCSGDMLKYVLYSFVDLMEHDIVSWDILGSGFIKRNIYCINNPKLVPSVAVESALSNLENIVNNGTELGGQIVREVSFESLLQLLQHSSSATPVIQQNTIALINAFFNKADGQRKKTIATTFSSKNYRNALQDIVTGSEVGAEMAHQLYALQTHMLGQLEHRMMSKMNTQDQETYLEKIKELRRIAFDDVGDNASEVTARSKQNTYSTCYKKLGFKCDINPAQDFTETPPGMLALDCMVYFARNYEQNYTKIVHENSCRGDEHECPFGRTSIELVKVLCEILHIGDPPSTEGQEYYPMFFTHDHPFEEFFCICIVVLNKTWKDMRATSEDFSKVSSVLREQISRTLKGRPTNLEDFKSKIGLMTYAMITNLRTQERTSKEECASTASAIVSLKKKITPRILQLIQSQRFNLLVEGTRFSKYSRGTRMKDRFWYARLSPNHKILHYGDCDEKTVPLLEELSAKVPVADFRQLLVGKECPKDNAKKIPVNLRFSIGYQQNSVNYTQDFVAPDQLTFDYWTDGINALLKQPMTSQRMQEDLETLLSMEIKLRLLDTESGDISSDPPPIPDDPDNYDFCFES